MLSDIENFSPDVIISSKNGVKTQFSSGIFKQCEKFGREKAGILRRIDALSNQWITWKGRSLIDDLE
jgi:hypothetical protein